MITTPLNFHTNWNGKLTNGAFTTLRIWNPDRYAAGAIFDIRLTDKDGHVKINYGEAAVAEVRKLKIHQINEYIARLDTGYSAEETRSILMTMYKNKAINWTTQELALVLLVKIKKTPTQQTLLLT